MLGFSVAALICYTFNLCLAFGRMAVMWVPVLPCPRGLCTALCKCDKMQSRLQTCSCKGRAETSTHEGMVMIIRAAPQASGVLNLNLKHSLPSGQHGHSLSAPVTAACDSPLALAAAPLPRRSVLWSWLANTLVSSRLPSAEPLASALRREVSRRSSLSSTTFVGGLRKEFLVSSCRRSPLV